MSKLSILSELWEFLKVRKKWWLLANHIFFNITWGTDNIDPRLSVSSIYLCNILKTLVTVLCVVVLVSFPLKRESKINKTKWIPTFVGMTSLIFE